jgi:CubicO group peptidase (beta-lactamase class C family)
MKSIFAAAFVAALCLGSPGRAEPAPLPWAQAPAASAALDAKIRWFETGLRPAVRRVGARPERWTLEERMRHYGVPGVSIAIIANGEVAWARGYGKLRAGSEEPVTTRSVFSVGSLSKVATATTILRLADEGAFDLDRDVNAYTRRWTVPQAGLDGEAVTLRRLMSHTAGTTVSGFKDFGPDEPLPTLQQILMGQPPAKNAPVVVAYRPGSSSAYSGGGTMVEQLVVENATAKPFAQVAATKVFEPLGMVRTTFLSPLPSDYGDIALAHDAKGAPTALPRGWQSFPETAASGLWTTPTDYGACWLRS